MKNDSGADTIFVKLLKLGKDALVSLLPDLTNMSIQSSRFPDRFKKDQVTLSFKKRSHSRNLTIVLCYVGTHYRRI